MRRGKSRYSKYKKARWSENQKLEACTSYAVLGNMKEVALVTGVSYNTLKVWKTEDWFKDLLIQIRDEDIQQLDSNLQKVIKKALTAVEDRLDHGDHQYDQKTRELVRVPVKAQIALRITTDLLTKQEKLRDAPKRAEVEKTIDARLAKLAEEFIRFSTAKTINQVKETPDHEMQPLQIIQENDHEDGESPEAPRDRAAPIPGRAGEQRQSRIEVIPGKAE